LRFTIAFRQTQFLILFLRGVSLTLLDDCEVGGRIFYRLTNSEKKCIHLLPEDLNKEELPKNLISVTLFYFASKGASLVKS